MRLIIISLLLICSLFTTFLVEAAGPMTRFERFSIEQGLSQTSVMKILQDRQGFLWFATEDGLNRYDGYSFKVFRHNADDPYAISGNTVQSAYEDTKGRLWFGTYHGGLNLYDPLTEQFRHFRHDPNDPNSLSNDNVWVITEDGKGRLWVGTKEAGLNLFERAG